MPAEAPSSLNSPVFYLACVTNGALFFFFLFERGRPVKPGWTQKILMLNPSNGEDLTSLPRPPV